MVEQVADILKAKQPGVCWCAGPIQYGVGHGLDRLPPSFRRILLLLVRFALPCAYEERAQDMFDFLTNQTRSSITDEFRWSSPVLDVILQRVDKLSLGFDTVYICDFGLGARKDYAHG